MDLKDWSIAVSAFVAALGYLAKTRHERRKATRTVLYYLLELHHRIHRIGSVVKPGPAKLVQGLRSILEQHGKFISDTETVVFSEATDSFLQVFLSTQLKEASDEISGPFARALAELAKEDPILAFRLHGRDKLLTIRHQLDAMMTSPTSSGSVAGITPSQSAAFNKFLLEEATPDIEKALKITAWKCDLLTHVQVRLRLRRLAKKDLNGFNGFLDDMVKKMLSSTEQAPQQAEVGAIH